MADEPVPAPNVATNPPPPQINSAHVVAAGALAGDITPILMWASHWPLQPLDQTTAGAIAGLIVAAVGGGALMSIKAMRAN